ncbi:hypothetical protein V6N13_039637 [Hibiscus sabdariffa]
MNSISGLYDSEGVWISDNAELLVMASNYFQELFQSSSPSDDTRITENVQPRVTSDLNDYLLSPFQSEEVWNAIKGMAPLKASGPDGYPALVFQKCHTLKIP